MDANAKHDFSPRMISLVRQTPSPLSRFLLYALAAMLCLFIFWAGFGQLDIIARAEGKLVPVNRIKIVQPLEGGRVAQVHVTEGMLVKAGDVLLEMDGILSAADIRKLEADLAAKQLEARRINAELEGIRLQKQDGDSPELYATVSEQLHVNQRAFQDKINEQLAALAQAEQQLKSDMQVLDKLERVLPIYREAEAAFSKLENSGYGSHLEAIDREKQRISIEKDLQVQQHTILASQAAIDAISKRIERIHSEQRKHLIEQHIAVNQQLAQIQEDIVKTEYRKALMVLRAPVSGYIQDLTIHNKGSVVPAGTVLMQLVPTEEPLQAEVYIENRDVAFVSIGQPAKIKLNSYEFQKYGMLHASVSTLSTDTASVADSQAQKTPAYRALLELRQQFIEKQETVYKLRPGMIVSAEINLGKRSMLDYLLSPIQKSLHTAVTER